MFDHQWYSNPVILAAIAVGCVLQLIIARTLPEGRRTLRTHAVIAGGGLLLTLLAHWLPPLGPTGGVDVLSELLVAGWGVLLIRIVGIALFRILMPALKLGQPRILHELVFLLACTAWALVRLRSAGLNLGGIVTTSAAITAIVAFSMQETLGNILGGLALQLDKSFHIGDWVLVEDVRGKVVEVHWRHTALLTPNGEIVVLPNSMLMKSKVTVISSIDYPSARRAIKFSTYDRVPPQDVIAAVEKALRDASLPHVAHQPPPDCVVTDFAGGSTQFAVRYWLTDQQHDAPTDSSVRLHIYSALRRHEVMLARPMLDVQVDADTDTRSATLRENEIDRRVDILANLPFFAGLRLEELRSVSASLRVTPFVRDDVMTRQGAVAHWLYVLTLGEADVWYESDDGQRHFIATLKAGEMFGEMGMMTGEARSATVTARTDAECFRIDKASFETVLRARPELADELARIVSARHAGLEAARVAYGARQDDDHVGVLVRIRRFFKLPQAVAAHDN